VEGRGRRSLEGYLNFLTLISVREKRVYRDKRVKFSEAQVLRERARKFEGTKVFGAAAEKVGH
jgi:uncharacterized protein (DUF934 family)